MRGRVVGNELVRSALLKTMFMSKFGARQTMDNAIVTTAATSRQKSMNTQTPINFLETILAVQAGEEY